MVVVFTVCITIKKKNILDYKKKDERGIEGVPELEWELSHHTYTPSIVEPLETPIIVLPHTDRRPEKAWHSQPVYEDVTYRYYDIYLKFQCV